MLEFRELLGLATVTCSKKSLNCANSKVTSFPLNILAKKPNFYDFFRETKIITITKNILYTYQ